MKVILKEEQQEKLKLPPFIYKAIVGKNTSIGDNDALPPFGDFGMEYAIARKGFEDADEIINKYIERGELKSKDVDYLLGVLSKKIERCKKLEAPLKPQLQKLCENIVNSTFSIPNDTIILKCRLVGKVKPKNDVRILPEGDEDGNTYDFDDVDEIELVNKVILKRRFVNSLIQGLSYWLSTDIDDYFDTVHGLNEEIWGLWYNIKHISDYLLYTKKDEINDKHPNLMSYVEVRLGKHGKKSEVDAQGIIFPYLLRDTFRGLLELFSAHSLPEDTNKALYIIKKADFLVAEPWDLRLGNGFVEMLKNSFKKYNVDLLFKTNEIPFFFSELCKFKTDEFNSVIKNFLLGTKKGNIIASEMDSNIKYDIDYQKFKDRIQKKNIDTSVISDGDFSKEELDGYVLQENEVDEMMAYHGSGSDFDKFNHKKFLNTGAGSQSFGWGTYVTDDKEVANGYSENAKGSDELYRIRDKIIEIIKNEFNEKDELKAKTKANHIVSMLGSNDDYNIDSLVNFLTNEIGRDIVNGNKDEALFYEEVIKVVNLLRGIDFKNHAFLYEVDIPEDNGQNYIEWYEHFPGEFMKRILHGFLRIPDKYLNMAAENNYPFKCNLYGSVQWMKANPNRAEELINIIAREDDYRTFFSSGFYTNKPKTEGRNIYHRLRNIFNSEKAASLFLMQCGFDGIKYPAGTMWKKPDGASEDAMNYVIFDANKVKIVNKTSV